MAGGFDSYTLPPYCLEFFRFDPEAQAVFDAWQNVLERRLRSVEITGQPALAAHLAKYRSLMPSLGLLLSLLEGVTRAQVSERAARLAADWCDYLEQHAAKVYAGGGRTHAARRLAEHIENGDVQHGETVRDVYRHGWSGLDTDVKVEAAARMLESLGWMHVVKSLGDGGSGRRPSPSIALHPVFRRDHEGRT